MTTIITGQSSALIMLCIVVAAMLWTRGRVVPACAVLGLLAIKPNWGIVFGLMAIVRGKWKGAAAMAGVALSLCLLTIPLGLQLWTDFVGISMANADLFANYDSYKLITVRGFIEGVFGRTSATLIVWEAVAVVLVCAALRAWRTHSSPLRHLSIAVLLAIAANPYAQFYDALVLAVPATVWWAERAQWNRRPWLVVGTMLAVAWCVEQWSYSWGVLLMTAGVRWHPPVSLVGPTAALWLVLEATKSTKRSVGASEAVA